ncbi:MAG: type II secretion system protein, partial [Kiritimatiellae bacterium]|nr:type II secretion system protein [Kiritimatiellia bacterium]
MRRIRGGRTRDSRGAARRRAFTLVEILVAVAILGLISTTVALVLSGSVSAWRTASDLAETGHDGETVMEQLVLALRSACYPSDGELSYDYGFQQEDDGDGDTAHDSISWTKTGTALVGEDVPWAGASHRVRVFVDDSGEDGPGLYATAWQIVGEPEDFDPDEDAVPVLLSDEVTALDVRMRDPEKAVEPDEPYEWIDEWLPSNRIPTHVLVTLSLKPARKGDDPQTLVRMVQIPMAEASWTPSKPGGSESGGENGVSRETTQSGNVRRTRFRLDGDGGASGGTAPGAPGGGLSTGPSGVRSGPGSGTGSGFSPGRAP